MGEVKDKNELWWQGYRKILIGCYKKAIRKAYWELHDALFPDRESDKDPWYWLNDDFYYWNLNHALQYYQSVLYYNTELIKKVKKRTYKEQADRVDWLRKKEAKAWIESNELGDQNKKFLI